MTELHNVLYTNFNIEDIVFHHFFFQCEGALIKFPIAIKSQILIHLPSSSIQSNWFWTMRWPRIETPSGLTPNFCKVMTKKMKFMGPKLINFTPDHP